MSSPKVPKHYSRLPGTSMGYKFDCSIIQTNENPGPGTYELPSLNIRSPIGTKFGGSPRFDLSSKNLKSPKGDSVSGNILTEPGMTQLSENVSNFYARQITKSNSSTFGKAGRPDFFPKTSFPHVGPGKYEIKDQAYLGGISKRNKSQFFESRKFTYFRTDTEIPGPGSYDVNKSEKSIKLSTGVGFSKSQKKYLDIDSLVKNSPNGSSYYSTAMPPLSKSVRGVSFGRQKKENIIIKDDHPGPGSYYFDELAKSPKSPFSKGTFGVSKKLTTENYYGDPGPGEYNPEQSISFHSTRRGVTFTKSLTTHFKNVWSSLPGPGNYDLQDEFSLKKQEIEKKLKMMKEKIEENKRNKELKALKPIMDDNKLRLLNPPSRCSSKIYNTKEDLDSSPGPKLYRDTVFEELVCQSSSPGPKYLIEGQITKDAGKRGTTFFLGKEIERGYIQELVNKKIPGPGAYKYEFQQEKKLPVSFAASKREEDIFVSKYKKTVPGVGLYEQKNENKATGGSFGKAIKPTAINKPAKKKFMRLESRLTGLDKTSDNIDINWDL